MRRVVGVALCAVALVVPAAAQQRTAQPRRKVIFILSDDHRHDFMSGSCVVRNELLNLPFEYLRSFGPGKRASPAAG